MLTPEEIRDATREHKQLIEQLPQHGIRITFTEGEPQVEVTEPQTVALESINVRVYKSEHR
jgi:hypothetical protein